MQNTNEPLTIEQIELTLAVVVPWFDALPTGEWSNLFCKISWPDTVYERATDYIPDTTRQPVIRLSHSQHKAVETVYDWLRLIDDKDKRFTVYFKNACGRPEIANDLIRKRCKRSTRTIQRWYNEGLDDIRKGLETRREMQGLDMAFVGQKKDLAGLAHL